MEIYITGTGQEMLVHDRKECDGGFCAIHNPSNHALKDCPTHWRTDRQIMERLCEHGVGHPDPDSLAFMLRNGASKYVGVHGCDGCCNELNPIKEAR